MKRLKKMIYLLLAFLLLLVVVIPIFLQQPKFGAVASGARLERMKASPNYRDGIFINLQPTPGLTEGTSYFGLFKELLFTKWPGKYPEDSIPSTFTSLKELNPDINTLVWFGHSSYFLQLDGRKFLVDPVFNGAASPIAATTRSFKNTDRYSPDDMPTIDLLVITHDHWDHLDHTTIKKLIPKVKQVICGLGVGAHLEKWGFDSSQIIEKDWWEKSEIDSSTSITLTPARHFSGRGLKRSGTLWTSYVLKTSNFNIYLGGDSGYDDQFAAIGEKFGPFDLAILEDGQYNQQWKYIHMMPEEVVQAGRDLKAKIIFPVHNSKFALANHPWKEPLQRVTAEAEKHNQQYITPIIGEAVILTDSSRQNRKWWETVK